LNLIIGFYLDIGVCDLVIFALLMHIKGKSTYHFI